MKTHDGDLLTIKGLSKDFPIHSSMLRRRIGTVGAVKDVSFTIVHGETLGLVGESGCGKSTTGRLLLRLLEPTSGEVWFEDRNVVELGKKELRSLRREMQIIFQDPSSSLHPRMTVGQLIGEPLVFHDLYGSRAKAEERVQELMATVGLSPDHRDRFPHEFSGGQRQRIGIARGLSVNPRFLVCDEPVSALDVSVQAQVLNLLVDLQKDFGLTYLFISHDLGVVRNVTDRVAVMYLGQLVELAETEALFERPMHPYTEALMSAIPVPDPVLARKRERVIVEGDVPSPSNPPPGCAFHPRCPYAVDVCRTDDPPLSSLTDHSGQRRFVACHRAEELTLLGVEGELPTAGRP